MWNEIILKLTKDAGFNHSHNFKYIFKELIKIDKSYIPHLNDFYTNIIEKELFCNNTIILKGTESYTSKIDGLLNYDIIENTIYYKCISAMLKYYEEYLISTKNEDEGYTLISSVSDLFYYYETLYDTNKSILKFKIVSKENLTIIFDDNPSMTWYIDNAENELSIEPKKHNNARNPIKWNGNLNDLAYLFWSLNRGDVIDIDSFGVNLSSMFVDNENKEISNTLFNKYSSEFNNKKYPRNAGDIDKLVKVLKPITKK